MTDRRAFLQSAAMLAVAAGCARTQASRELPEATPEKLPRWRGFNLLEKFQRDSAKPFVESDFEQIAELGFDFVRLPMDYRCWCTEDARDVLLEEPLRDIDQAVAWGERYGIHVMINFHRAPGYTVARPAEPASLWTDGAMQELCAAHWATFAGRYAGIPSSRLSFNLFNEPAGVEAGDYVAVVGPIAEAIRREDPERLIVSDGLQWGSRPIPELKPLRIAQATRGYAPMQLTHYQASWVGGSDLYPVPTWPRILANGTLVSPGKEDLSEEARGPLVVDGVAGATELRLHLVKVSQRAVLAVRADGTEIWRREFVCGPGEGEWAEAIFEQQWNIWANRYDLDCLIPLPAGARRVEVQVVEGDWCRLSVLALRDGAGGEHAVGLSGDWNQAPAHLTYADGRFDCDRREDRAALKQQMIDPWTALAAQGVGVMVGEFGSFNRTPHEVVIRWMTDCLTNWREAGWGWALWNFRGSFGILDSGRADVAYEDWRGHKLDRAMLELLQGL